MTTPRKRARSVTETGGGETPRQLRTEKKSKAPLDAVRGLVAVCRREIARVCFRMKRESQSRPHLDRLEDRASGGRGLEESGSSKEVEGLGEDELRLVLQGLGCAAVASTWTSSPPGKVAEVRSVDHLALLGLHGHSLHAT